MREGEGELETIIGNVGVRPSSHHASRERCAGRGPEGGSDTEGGHCLGKEGQRVVQQWVVEYMDVQQWRG